ncbi:telomere stability and silencing-domain-containing protein [Kockovaella imperatae]|uniref:Telomere stability and silencing-domain-containing protein n=1 Tax=Kockovaella imperatae TaxID=4999 RepID=A0A1Y1ULT1_9TREE|nr:telomere stability and silencing-domain-containing protein [Kockovaella imperatae]ORX38942.1 telomere stability and silencing-domain-containing protein [Kockovaella imperatae]
MMTRTVFVHLPSPLVPLHLSLPPSTPLSSLPLPVSLAASSSTYLRTISSGPLDPSTLISDLSHDESPSHPITLHLGVRVLGGKGGFGANLRAAGGRMNKSAGTNVDACRDLSGRRLSTIKEAKRQAELLESLPALRAAAQAADKAKLEALERALGISSDQTSDLLSLPEDETRGERSSTGAVRAATGSKRIAEVDLEELAMKKHKFDDNEFLEQSREIKDNVRNAVAAGES